MPYFSKGFKKLTKKQKSTAKDLENTEKTKQPKRETKKPIHLIDPFGSFWSLLPFQKRPKCFWLKIHFGILLVHFQMVHFGIC